uniref:Sm domain-containing protein n=1 Tax=Oxyrrhis marina TaxID=2969 RepID=A0A6U9LQ56_OXYMA
MQKRVRVEVRDGRVFIGSLECVDYLRNLAVSDAYEVGVRRDDGSFRSRRPVSIGVLMIPPEQLKKIEAGGPPKAARYQPPDGQCAPLV